MDREYARDVVDGVEVDPLVFVEDGVLPSGHSGSIHVESAHVRLSGFHQGSLWLWGDTTLELAGEHQGSLHAADRSIVTVTGRQQGSTHATDEGIVRILGSAQGSAHTSAQGQIVVEVGGRHQGSVHNEGRYVLRGKRGGSLSGSGEYVEEAGSTVIPPETRDGITINRW